MKLTIHLDKPNTLAEKIPEEIRYEIEALKITGLLGKDDFNKVLDEMCDAVGGYDEYDDFEPDFEETPKLRILDMGEATFVDGSAIPYFGFHAQLKCVVFPKGIKLSTADPNESGLQDSDMLRKVVFPEGIETVGGFQNCPNLCSINLPDSINEIYSFAFSGCKSLQISSLPKNLSSFDGSSFADCNINAFDIDNDFFVSVDGVVFTKDLTKLVAFPSAFPYDRYSVPEGTKIIGWGAFMDSSIKEIIIPESVEIIEGWSFQWSQIESIYIPDSVHEIGELAFRYCKNLNNIRLSENLRAIPDQLFTGCNSLKRIEIPGSVKSIELCALAWSGGLEEIILHDGVEEIRSNGPMRLYDLPLRRVTIPKTLKSFQGAAFGKTKHWDIFEIDGDNPYFIVREGVLYSHDGTVLVSIPNRSIEAFSIPEGVRVIEEMVFIYMNNLRNVVLPESIVEIKERAFQGCNSLTELRLPSSLEKMHYLTLWADNLRDVYVPCSTPPELEDAKEKDWIYSKVTAHIPMGTLDKYASAPGWSNFILLEDIE